MAGGCIAEKVMGSLVLSARVARSCLSDGDSDGQSLCRLKLSDAVRYLPAIRYGALTQLRGVAGLRQ